MSMSMRLRATLSSTCAIRAALRRGNSNPAACAQRASHVACCGPGSCVGRMKICVAQLRIWAPAPPQTTLNGDQLSVVLQSVVNVSTVSTHLPDGNLHTVDEALADAGFAPAIVSLRITRRARYERCVAVPMLWFPHAVRRASKKSVSEHADGPHPMIYYSRDHAEKPPLLAVHLLHRSLFRTSCGLLNTHLLWIARRPSMYSGMLLVLM